MVRECKICGVIASEGSIYCQKCGKKLDEEGISARELSAFLQEKMEMSDIMETQQYCRALIDKVGNRKFQEVEIHRSSLEGLDFTDLIYEEDNRLYINCQEPEDFLKLTGALLINKIDCLQTELNEISRGLHNDRMAELETAYTLFRRGMLTKYDEARKTKLFDDASSICIEGINKLKKEMDGNLELLQKYPRNTVKKLFCGISRQKAEGAYKQMQEALPWYCDAVRLLMSIDMQNKETEKLNMTIAEERKFLGQMRGCKGYRRLQEVIEDNAKVWDECVDGLKVDMYCAENLISEDTVTVKLLEERI